MTRGLEAIKEFEGLRLEAYPDPATGGEPWTIGWGHTGGIKQGDKITLEQAEAYLMGDVAVCQDAIKDCVNVPLTEGQLWALTSFAFNLGVERLKSSTLLKFLNDGDYLAAADQFPRWIFANGKPMTGLISRRATERSMFMEGVPEGSHAPVSHPGAEAVTTPQPPVETHVPVPVVKKDKFMLPLIPIFTALLPTLIESIPRLKALFPGGEVSDRNVKVAEVAFQVAQTALGAANAQQVVQMVQDDPAAAQTVAKAVEDNWAKLDDTRESSIDKARTFYQSTPTRIVFGNMVFHEVLALLMVMLTGVGMFCAFAWGDLDAPTKNMIVTMALIGGFLGIKEFFYGGSRGSDNKTALMAEQQRAQQ